MVEEELGREFVESDGRGGGTAEEDGVAAVLDGVGEAAGVAGAHGGVGAVVDTVGLGEEAGGDGLEDLAATTVDLPDVARGEVEVVGENIGDEDRRVAGVVHARAGAGGGGGRDEEQAVGVFDAAPTAVGGAGERRDVGDTGAVVVGEADDGVGFKRFGLREILGPDEAAGGGWRWGRRRGVEIDEPGLLHPVFVGAVADDLGAVGGDAGGGVDVPALGEAGGGEDRAEAAQAIGRIPDEGAVAERRAFRGADDDGTIGGDGERFAAHGAAGEVAEADEAGGGGPAEGLAAEVGNETKTHDDGAVGAGGVGGRLIAREQRAEVLHTGGGGMAERRGDIVCARGFADDDVAVARNAEGGAAVAAAEKAEPSGARFRGPAHGFDAVGGVIAAADDDGAVAGDRVGVAGEETAGNVSDADEAGGGGPAETLRETVGCSGAITGHDAAVAGNAEGAAVEVEARQVAEADHAGGFSPAERFAQAVGAGGEADDGGAVRGDRVGETVGGATGQIAERFEGDGRRGRRDTEERGQRSRGENCEAGQNTRRGHGRKWAGGLGGGEGRDGSSMFGVHSTWPRPWASTRTRIDFVSS